MNGDGMVQRVHFVDGAGKFQPPTCSILNGSCHTSIWPRQQANLCDNAALAQPALHALSVEPVNQKNRHLSIKRTCTYQLREHAPVSQENRYLSIKRTGTCQSTLGLKYSAVNKKELVIANECQTSKSACKSIQIYNQPGKQDEVQSILVFNDYIY